MLDKFKNIKPTPAKKPAGDDVDSYFDSLDSLKPRPDMKKIFYTIGTVAAIFIVTFAVVMWSVIGGGVRTEKDDGVIIPADSAEEPDDKVTPTVDSDPPVTDADEQIHLPADSVTIPDTPKEPDTPTEPQPQPVAVTVTDEMKANFKHFNTKYALNYMPLFDEDQRPSIVEMMDYLSHTNEICFSKIGYSLSYGGTRIPTGEDLNFFSKTLFDVEYDVDEDFWVSYVWQKLGEELPPYGELITLTELDLGDGTKQFEVTYSFDGTVRVLTYIGKQFYDAGEWNVPINSFDPLKFISCVEKDTPLKKDYIDEKIFYCIRDEVLGSEYITNSCVAIDRVTSLGGGSYSCRAELREIIYTDRQEAEYHPMHLLGQLPGINLGTIDALYFTYKDGVITRDTDQHITYSTTPRGDRGEFTEINDPDHYKMILEKYCVGDMPLFEDSSQLSKDALLEYAAYFDAPPESADELNKLIYSTFGFDPEFSGDISIEKTDKHTDITPISMRIYGVDIGYNVFEIIYEKNSEQYVIKYINKAGYCIGNILSNTKNKESNKES